MQRRASLAQRTALGPRPLPIARPNVPTQRSLDAESASNVEKSVRHRAAIPRPKMDPGFAGIAGDAHGWELRTREN